MVGLPEDPFEAEAAKNKFVRSVNTLMKSYLDVIEARAKIKFSPKSPKKERRRYEVNVIIKTREGIRVFQDSGWDLPDIFDSIGLRIRRILAQKYSKRKRRE